MRSQRWGLWIATPKTKMTSEGMMVKTWLLRLGDKGQYEDDAIEGGLISISFGITTDLTQARSKAELRQQLLPYGWTARSLGQRLPRIHAFINEMKVGDLVLARLKKRNGYGLAEVSETHLRLGGRPAAKIIWIDPDIGDDSLPFSFFEILGQATIKEAGSVVSRPVLELKYRAEVLINATLELGPTIEGRVRELVRLHKIRERSATLVIWKKNSATERRCQACGMTFGDTYGPLGEGYIECHHDKPLSEYNREGEITDPDNLLLLCANCHRMIHRHMAQNPSISNHLAELKELVAARKTAFHT